MADTPQGTTVSRESFCSLIENVEDYAIVAMDLEGRVVHCNVGTVRMTGFETSELLGKPLDQIFTPEDVAAGAPQIELRAAASLGRAANERWPGIAGSDTCPTAPMSDGIRIALDALLEERAG